MKFTVYSKPGCPYCERIEKVLTLSNLENKIYTIRGVQVMLDGELSFLYHTETKHTNRAVSRNPGRFPVDFASQLTEPEWESLRFQIDTLNHKAGRWQHGEYLPRVFTEQGLAIK